MKTRYALAALAALTSTTGSALARPIETDDQAPAHVTVSYADLNVNTPDGQAVLVARIHRAAEKVCGPEPDSRDLKRAEPYRQCTKQSVDAAVAAIPTANQLAGTAKPAG
jgi:UrcA family protein